MVSKNTLITDAWDSVYTYIRTTNALSTTNIFSAWNSTLATNKGYPIVIVSIPEISYSKLNLTGEFTSCEVTIPFEIYNKTAQTVKSQADEVITKLFAGKNTLANAGFFNMEIGGMASDVWSEGKKKIHVISFDIIFRYVEK